MLTTIKTGRERLRTEEEVELVGEILKKRDGLHVKGQNVISLIECSLCLEKKRDILSPHSPLRRSDSVVETEKRHKDKAENSPKGWLHLQLRPISRQKAFSSPSQQTVSTEGSSFVCQPHSFILHLTSSLCEAHAHTLL